MVARKPEVPHGVPRCLLALHEQANGTSLDGEGIQAWLEWEMEAMRWRVPVEISRADLKALVDSSEVRPKKEHQHLHEGDRPEPETLSGTGIILKPPETTSNGEEGA